MTDPQKTQDEKVAEIAAAIKAGEQKPDEPIKLSTGEEFANLETLKKAKVDTSEALRDRERQIKELQAALEKNQPPVSDKKNGFDKVRFWQLMDEDPIMATNYAISFGWFGGEIKPEEVQGEVIRIKSVVDYVEDMGQVQSFLTRHPEYPGGEAGEMVFEAIKKSGEQWNANTIERHYLVLKDEGKIKPLTDDQMKEQGLAPSRLTAPPSLPAGGGTGDTSLDAQIAAAEGLSKKDFDALLVQTGLKQ